MLNIIEDIENEFKVKLTNDLEKEVISSLSINGKIYKEGSNICIIV